MLARRIMLMFFSDKAYVTGALYNIVIIIFMFVAFLGENTAINMMFFAGLEPGTFDQASFDAVIIGLVFGGLISVISVTTCLGSLQIIVEDKSKSGKDFHISPVARAKISRGYILGSAIIGIFLTSVALLICVVYMGIVGGSFPSPAELGMMALAIVLSVLCANSFIYLIIVSLKRTEAFHAFSSVLASIIGFLMGVYVPLAVLPEALQWIVRIFPLTHSASMFRQVLADNQLATFFVGSPEALDDFRTIFGVAFDFGPFLSTFWMSAAYLAISTVVFYTLSIVIVRRKINHE